MTGRNAWDTTPEEEPEVVVEIEPSDDTAIQSLEAHIIILQGEQQVFYSVTRQHQIDKIKREIRTRGETGG